MRYVTAILAVIFVLSGHGRSQPASDNTFSVMTYNLRQYALTDRDGGGEPNDPKPEKERRAVTALIARERPDVLTVQEMGGAAMFAQFR
ncbi:MAG: hypothetical protein WC334_11085, partial [Kiritimatiellales bacterium]